MVDSDRVDSKTKLAVTATDLVLISTPLIAPASGEIFRPDPRHFGVNDGRCVNLTGEKIAVYGPKHPEDKSKYDNSLYILPSGYETPDDWDCDGILAPNDRIG